MDDRLDHILVRAIAASDVDMRFGVRRAPFLRESFEHRLGIIVAQLRAGITAGGPFGEDFDWRVKPHGDRALVEQLAGRRIDIGTAAGRDHSDVAFDQPGDEPALAIAKVALPEALEHFGGWEAGGAFDLCIAVDKGQAKPSSEAAPHRRLSNPHQPDQHHRPVKTPAQICHRKAKSIAQGAIQRLPRSAKAALMSRLIILIILAVLIIGGLFFLARSPKQQPTHTIEVAVPAPGGNAH